MHLTVSEILMHGKSELCNRGNTMKGKFGRDGVSGLRWAIEVFAILNHYYICHGERIMAVLFWTP